MAIKRDSEVDFTKSTMAFPMGADPVPIFVAADIDYAQSTGAYPMHDAPAMAAATTRVVEHIDVDGADRVVLEHTVEHVGSDVASEAFPTPGPVSAGVAEDYQKQRAELGLSDNPSGEADHGYEARPSTVSVPGADGVDRDHGHQEQAKVVAPPAKTAPVKRTRARGK